MQLPLDIQKQIALELKPTDLIAFCLSNKTINQTICNDSAFWRLKLERDYPIDFESFQKSGLVFKYPKNTYIRYLQSEIKKIEETYTFNRYSSIIKREKKKEDIVTWKKIIAAILDSWRQASHYKNFPFLFSRFYTIDQNIVNKNRDKFITLLVNNLQKQNLNLTDDQIKDISHSIFEKLLPF